MRKAAKRMGRRAERVVVDSIFDDGTVRILRAERKKHRTDDGLDIEAWEPEKEYTVQLDAMALPLRDELGGRTLQEGDILFLANGPAFFERKVKDAGQASRKAQGRRRPRPERLLCPIDDAKDMARQEIKREFAKLVVGQGVQGTEARARLFEGVDQAMARREQLELSLRRPQAEGGE